MLRRCWIIATTSVMVIVGRFNRCRRIHIIVVSKLHISSLNSYEKNTISNSVYTTVGEFFLSVTYLGDAAYELKHSHDGVTLVWLGFYSSNFDLLDQPNTFSTLNAIKQNIKIFFGKYCLVYRLIFFSKLIRRNA